MQRGHPVYSPIERLVPHARGLESISNRMAAHEVRPDCSLASW
jgi:hypothetical protein